MYTVRLVVDDTGSCAMIHDSCECIAREDCSIIEMLQCLFDIDT